MKKQSKILLLYLVLVIISWFMIGVGFTTKSGPFISTSLLIGGIIGFFTGTYLLLRKQTPS